jgi:uncharacterized protein (TIGR00297 family)
MTSPQSAERTRQAVHVAMGAFGLLLRYLSWWQAAILAGAALAFNRFVLPNIGGTRLYRAAEHTRGYSAGMLVYPLSVLILIFLFPSRLDIVAAAWGILAAGDGMATIVGTHLSGTGRGARVPWNRDKSVAGSLALFVCGGTAGAFLAWWCRPAVAPAPDLWFSLAAPFAAAAIAALAETIPVRLDDNLTVPMTAAAVLWAASLMRGDAIAASVSPTLHALPVGVMLNAVVAAAGYRAGTVSTSGAIVGACIGAVIYVTTGWQGWLLLMVTFLVASVTTRMGLRRKTLLGIAEERGGRRGAGNAIANTGLAALAALLAVTTHASGAAMIGFAAALTAGGSDTVASEIGKALGRRTYMVHTFTAVPPGTPGAISLEGTAAGLVCAFALAAAGAALGLVPRSALAAIVAGATIGAFAESALSATLEHRGILNNDILNFLNTGIAAVSAIYLSRLM